MSATLHIFTHAWRSALDAGAQIASHFPCMVLLHSGVQTSYSGEHSWLACDAMETIEGSAPSLLTHLQSNPLSRTIYGDHILPQWFGYLSYELGYTWMGLQPHTIAQPPFIHAPLLRFSRFKRIFHFHHPSQTLTEYTHEFEPFSWDNITTLHASTQLPSLSPLRSPMSKEQYLEHVSTTIDAIARGDLYQANITRKFHGDFTHVPSNDMMFHLYSSLCSISPAPYSAFMQWPQHGHIPPLRIISSSPELFISHNADSRCLTTRPIKGTMPREDSAAALAKSEKNKAENLMITDLMRNDFSRIGELGSVKTPVLYDVDSFSTLHHLSSTVTARTLPHVTLANILQACFPAGSMTGAPKYRVMQWCNQIEQLPRGIYSGTLGWIAGDHCEFSVIIRTLLQQDTHLEFQVGGGIVHDSTPENEWQETLTKARAILLALNIPTNSLSAL